MIAETYLELVTDPNHWLLEITIMLVVDFLLLYVLWGFIKRHIHRDDKTLEDRIIEEVDHRFNELVKHMHEDSGIDHSDYHAEQIAGRDDI